MGSKDLKFKDFYRENYESFKRHYLAKRDFYRNLLKVENTYDDELIIKDILSGIYSDRIKKVDYNLTEKLGDDDKIEVEAGIIKELKKFAEKNKYVREQDLQSLLDYCDENRHENILSYWLGLTLVGIEHIVLDVKQEYLNEKRKMITNLEGTINYVKYQAGMIEHLSHLNKRNGKEIKKYKDKYEPADKKDDSIIRSYFEIMFGIKKIPSYEQLTGTTIKSKATYTKKFRNLLFLIRLFTENNKKLNKCKTKWKVDLLIENRNFIEAKIDKYEKIENGLTGQVAAKKGDFNDKINKEVLEEFGKYTINPHK